MKNQKRIGILTFHNAVNYGAALQAYALNHCLNEKYHADVLNYKCDRLTNIYFERSFIKNLISACLFPKNYFDKKNRVKKFMLFIDNYVSISEQYNRNNIVDANKNYDAFVAGSDQIWNLRITGNDFTYFLDFADEGKKYSYAGSFGGDPRLFDEKRDVICDYLSSFESLLLREKDGIEYLYNIGVNRPTKLVCDPVFLLSRECWIESLKLKKDTSDYIFVYIVGKDDKSIDYARKLAQKEGLKIKIIQLYKGRNAYVKGTLSAMDAGPIDFLNLIMNAKYIVTTSFHAMALAMIFNVDFYYELSHDLNNKNSRLENLARIFSVEGREIKDMNENASSINWDRINSVIDTYSSESKKLLYKSLEKM